MANRKFTPAVAAVTCLSLLIVVFTASVAQAHRVPDPVGRASLVSPVQEGDGRSEEPPDRLPTTGGPLLMVWVAGAAAVLTGGVVAIAVRDRRRMLRGAQHW